MRTKYHPSRKSLKPSKRVTMLILVSVLLLLFTLIPLLKDFVVDKYSGMAWFIRSFVLATYTETIYPWGSVNEKDFLSSINEANVEILKKENEDLKQMMGRRLHSKAILSRILLKPPQVPYDEVLLDVGTFQGVYVGSELYDGSGAVVGTISSVTEKNSRAKLFSTPGTKIETEMLKNGTILTLVGTGDGSFSVVVPRDFSASEGDLFILPGLKSSPLAKVIKIVSEAEDSFKTIYAAGFFEPRTITWVFVEIENKSS